MPYIWKKILKNINPLQLQELTTSKVPIEPNKKLHTTYKSILVKEWDKKNWKEDLNFCIHKRLPTLEVHWTK
jgi:hypothetical protein